MKQYVIDASVAVKWYSKPGENDLGKSDRLLQMLADGRCEFIAPTLITYELCNALRFNPNFQTGDVQQAVTSFFGLQIVLRDPSEYMETSIQLAFKYSLTIYDAVYAGLAQVACVPLITADYKFHSKTKELPFIVALKDIKL